MVLLIMAGFLASTKRPGWKILGFITGEVYIYLGVITMIIPSYAGSWGEASGLFAIFGGVLYMLIVLAEAEGTDEKVSKPVDETANTPEVLPELETVTPSASEPVFDPEILRAYMARESLEMREPEPVGMGRK